LDGDGAGGHGRGELGARSRESENFRFRISGLSLRWSGGLGGDAVLATLAGGAALAVGALARARVLVDVLVRVPVIMRVAVRPARRGRENSRTKSAMNVSESTRLRARVRGMTSMERGGSDA
jgi:hypothetical protein